MASSNDILYLHTIYFVNNFTVRRLVLVSVVGCFFPSVSFSLSLSLLSFLIAFTNWMCLTFHDTFGRCWTETHDYIADYFAVCMDFARENGYLLLRSLYIFVQSSFECIICDMRCMKIQTMVKTNGTDKQTNEWTKAKPKGNPSKNKLDLFRMRSLLMLSYCSNFFFISPFVVVSLFLFLFYW